MSEETPKFLYSYRLNESGKGESLSPEEVVGWEPSVGRIWVHLDVAEQSACEWLSTSSGLPAGALDILLAEETRPRSVVFDNGMVVVLRGVNTNPGDDPEDMVSVRVWIDEPSRHQHAPPPLVVGGRYWRVTGCR